MDPQKFSGENSGPGDIPTALQLEMLMRMDCAPPRKRCSWSGCKKDALWLVLLTPECERTHAHDACEHHASMLEAYVHRAVEESQWDDSVTLFCRICYSRKTGVKKEPIR